MKKKLFRILLLALAALATLVALFYAWTDWAGARRWKSVEASLRAKGEPLTIAEIEPAPIPDEINFAAAPIFAGVTSASDSGKPRIAKIPAFTGAFRKGSSELANAARSVNPKFAGSDEDAARLVLAEASKSQAIFDAVREAAKAPGTDWKLNFQKGIQMPIPQIQPLLKLAQSLSSQAKARLTVGDSRGALADVLLTIDLAGRVAPPELLITHLVSQSMRGLTLSAVKFGLTRHVWTHGELETLSLALSKISTPHELANALRVERALANDSVWNLGFSAILKSSQFADAAKPSWSEQILLATAHLYPSGWFLADRSLYSTTIQTLIEALGNPAPHFPEHMPALMRIPPAQHSLSARVRTPLSTMALPGISNAVKRTFQLQFQLDAARTACAIERYRLAHGALPQSLDALCPEFLSKPTPDLMTGEPLHYKPGPGDSYVLYSVGWNEIDDGGSAVDPKRPARKDSPDAADWVWKIDARP
jgi:hypothetical protein